MAVKFIATLGPKGWVTDGKTMLDMVMSWAYASDASQSYFFNKDITSIADIIQKHAGRIDQATVALQEALTTYLSKFFDDVQLECVVFDKEMKDFHLQGEVMLRASMIDHTGQELQLSEIMTNKGSVVRTQLDYDPL